MMRSAASLQRHDARCLARKELEHLGPHETLAEYHMPGCIGAVCLKYQLRNVEPDRANLSHERLLWWLLNTSILALRCRRGRPPHQDDKMILM
jgi:hypothetical protein